MTENEILEELELKLQRAEAAEACRNLMGKYSYYHTAFRNKEYIDLWAKRDDDLLIMPWGSYEGFEGVKKCYMGDHGDRNDPETFESLKGAVMMHEMDTEVLEVAEDAKTAKGAWLSPGHETWVEGSVPGTEGGEKGKAHAEWCWGKYGVDFIKDDDGQWKIWHMRLYPVFKCEYGTSWVDAEQPKPEDFTFTQAKKASKIWSYSKDRLYPANQPPVPWPYKTFDDVGIEITEEED
ncbi:MAG: nuclear transport factor 2 family protein [Eubacterium sp.]|nr:nuclear transport factor 2 family protein [Eubacterium sp.]